MEDHKVTFKYKDSKSNEWKLKTLDAIEFIRCFLQHVLPKGFQKVRYYGFLGSASRGTFEKIRQILGYKKQVALLENKEILSPIKSGKREQNICPNCGKRMKLVGAIHRQKRAPPRLLAETLINYMKELTTQRLPKAL